MKQFSFPAAALAALAYLAAALNGSHATAETVLFEDNFDRGIPGWTAVQPQSDAWIDGPMRWLYDINNSVFVEDSNIYSGPAGASADGAAVMLVNDTVVTDDDFTFSARLISGDDDGQGLVFGYQDENNFYRITFGTQARSGWPFDSWHLERRVNNGSIPLAGDDGTPEFSPDFDPGIFKYTINRPFDVTVQVTSGNLVTITVVDDPEGFASPYTLVQDFVLETDAKGQVGLMAWGQRGGDSHPLPGANFANVQLSPQPLTGDPEALPGWEPFIPANRAGSNALTRRAVSGRWGLGLGVGGQFGTLQDHSHAYMWGTDDFGVDRGPDGNTHVDFIGSSIAGGEAAWTDYVFYARMLPRNTQGHGLILRYQDPDNFYRVTLANPSGALAGRPNQGLSVQKKVNGLWEQVYWERHPDDPDNVNMSAAQFFYRIPASTYLPGLPYDILARIEGQQLMITVIDDPEGNSKAYFYSPIEFEGDVLVNGKIGFHNWANLFLEIDSAKVYSAEQPILYIASRFDVPDFEIGPQAVTAGEEVTISVPEIVEPAEPSGVRYVALGWSGSGSVPESGAANSVTFTPTADSTLFWNWQTQYWVEVDAEAGGQATASQTDWVPSGTEVTFTAQADPGFQFKEWTGDVTGVFPQVTVTANSPLSAIALFEPAEDIEPGGDLLFADYFDGGIPGWTAVQPASNWTDGPMRWLYDINNSMFVEDSNIYSPPAAASGTLAAVMLINDTVVMEDEFTLSARLIAGDDDGQGLVFGYEDQNNFHRITFGTQTRSGWPFDTWHLDRRVNNESTPLAGAAGSITDPSVFKYTMDRPFDVTVHVHSGNLLTITVVDDPEGSAVSYTLVEDFALEAEPKGQVGLMAWGQRGGDARPFPGANFSNVELTPVPLSGNPNALQEWTTFIPAQATGSTALQRRVVTGRWGLALNVNGEMGTLQEHSNAFQWGTDVGGNTHIDYIGSSIVAGDFEWEDYLMYARIMPRNPQGHGLILRYQDPDNFYRVGFARTGTSAGRPIQGLSVQKRVNGVWEQVWWEHHPDNPADVNASQPQFLFQIPASTYASGLPYDIYASMQGSQLDIMIVDDPEGSATVYRYGPIFFTGDTLGSGKIGFHNWANLFLEIDFVEVYELQAGDVFLSVSSPLGVPSPDIGLNFYRFGEEITASVPATIEEVPGVRHTATGWAGSGSVPESGTGNTATFDLTQNSVIAWEWTTEYRLNVQAGDGGEVIVSTAEEWLAPGTAVSIEAQADAGYMFAGWVGDFSALNPNLEVSMNRPIVLTAQFLADSDGDGIPDEWKLAHFGTLDVDPDADADDDGRSNREEFELGTDPNVAEPLLVEDGILPSVFENTQRDWLLGAWWVVHDFGDGYKGIWENSNDYRAADATTGRPAIIPPELIVPNVSFDGPRLIVREDAWDPDWNDYTLSVVFVVGDDDNNDVYVRYQDENNWVRVSIGGEMEGANQWRAPFGVSVQKRVDGVFTELGRDQTIGTDPADTSWFKKVRVTVTVTGSQYEVRVIPFDTFLFPPDWNPGFEVMLFIDDSDLLTGRPGIGAWGQGGHPAGATELLPVDNGVLIHEVVITVGAEEVIREDWTDVPVAEVLPENWENPMIPTGLQGQWLTSAHQTLVQRSNLGTATSGTAVVPRGDGEGPVLLAPDQDSSDYFLDIGIHPFTTGGVGFVYDFIDADNYSRALFVNAPSGAGRIPQGLTISRKEDGVWTDQVLGDTFFIYEPGHPFTIAFANNNGEYRLSVQEVDNPGVAYRWAWTAQPAREGNRFGIATWQGANAHFLHANAYGLARTAAVDLIITGITFDGVNITLEISNPTGLPFDVQAATDLATGEWTTVVSGLTDAQWSTPAPETNQTYWRLVIPE